MGSQPEQHPERLETTGDYLAAILGELRTIRSQLAQEPPEPDLDQPRLVTEPAPQPAKGGRSEVHQ